jgi:LysM repeat protein
MTPQDDHAVLGDFESIELDALDQTTGGGSPISTPTYSLQNRDNLTRIAERADVSLNQLKAWNRPYQAPGAHLDLIHPGDHVNVTRPPDDRHGV